MENSKANDSSLHRDLNIWIDSYDDLFSDFDSRHFTERVISDDFLVEMKKLTEEKDEFIKTVRFQIPSKVRDEKSESVIIERLSKDFHREFIRSSLRLKKSRRNSFFMALSGLLALMSAVFISSLEGNKLWHNFLKVLFEPAGWFLIWSGMDKLFFGGKSEKRKRDFYELLEKSKIEFVSI